MGEGEKKLYNVFYSGIGEVEELFVFFRVGEGFV